MNWTDGFEGAITICDRKGIIVYMNEVSRKQFAKYGGGDLVGKNLLNCHSEKSQKILQKMLEVPMKNAYTTEKNGIITQILQTPWMEEGEFCGVIEISFEIPAKMPHHKRS